MNAGLKRGQLHHNWKGDKRSYTVLHMRLNRLYGIPTSCEECGLETAPSHVKRRYFEWANVTGIYNDQRINWKTMCVRCHRLHDGTMPWQQKKK